MAQDGIWSRHSSSLPLAGDPPSTAADETKPINASSSTSFRPDHFPTPTELLQLWSTACIQGKRSKPTLPASRLKEHAMKSPLTAHVSIPTRAPFSVSLSDNSQSIAPISAPNLALCSEILPSTAVHTTARQAPSLFVKLRLHPMRTRLPVFSQPSALHALPVSTVGLTSAHNQSSNHVRFVRYLQTARV